MGQFGKRAWRKQKRILRKIRSEKGDGDSNDISIGSDSTQKENVERLEGVADDLLDQGFVSEEEQQDSEKKKEIENDSRKNTAKEHRRDINQRWR